MIENARIANKKLTDVFYIYKSLASTTSTFEKQIEMSESSIERTVENYFPSIETCILDVKMCHEIWIELWNAGTVIAEESFNELIKESNANALASMQKELQYLQNTHDNQQMLLKELQTKFATNSQAISESYFITVQRVDKLQTSLNFLLSEENSLAELLSCLELEKATTACTLSQVGDKLTKFNESYNDQIQTLNKARQLIENDTEQKCRAVLGFVVKETQERLQSLKELPTKELESLSNEEKTIQENFVEQNIQLRAKFDSKREAIRRWNCRRVK